jgi:hypothetical protein
MREDVIEYLLQDRQWLLDQRIAHARYQRGLNDADTEFWDAVLMALTDED